VERLDFVDSSNACLVQKRVRSGIFGSGVFAYMKKVLEKLMFKLLIKII